MPTVVCETCGKPFTRKQSALNKVKHHYCSESCSNIAKKRPPPIFTCRRCGKIFESQNRMKNRVYCSYECANAAKETSIDIPCDVCGNRFTVTQSRLESGARFCSIECLNVGRARGMVISNPKGATVIERICQNCGKTFNAKPVFVKKGQAKYCSHTCYSKSLVFIRGDKHPSSKPKIHKACLQCGKPLVVIPSVANRTKFCSRQCAGVWHVTHSSISSSLEKIVAAMLDFLGITYEQQKGIGPYACDFYVPSVNLVIEADGTYWHSLPKNKVRDRRKTTFLLNQNYRLLRLPEDKVRKDPSWCKKQIHKALKSGPWQSPIW